MRPALRLILIILIVGVLATPRVPAQTTQIVSGTALSKIQTGEAGRLSVVELGFGLTGPSIAVWNNTDSMKSALAVLLTVRNNSDNELAIAYVQTVTPRTLQPGQVGFARFSIWNTPPGAAIDDQTFSYEAYESGLDYGSISNDFTEVPIPITSLTEGDGTLSGSGLNVASNPIDDVFIRVLCFDQNMAPIDYFGDLFEIPVPAAPGEQFAFVFQLESPCDYYLVELDTLLFESAA